MKTHSYLDQEKYPHKLAKELLQSATIFAVADSNLELKVFVFLFLFFLGGKGGGCLFRQHFFLLALENTLVNEQFNVLIDFKLC